MAPVTFDSVGAGVYVTGSGATAGSYSHTIAGNGVVGIANCFSTTTNNVVTMKCGLTSMNQLGVIQWDTTSGIFAQLLVFGLLTPPTGAQTMSIVNTGGGNSFYGLSFNSVSYGNVGSFGTCSTNAGSTGTSLSHSGITSAADRMVIQAFGKNTTGVVTSPNQTSRWNTAGNGNAKNMPIQDAAGAGSPLTFSCTDGANPKWASIVLDIIPPAGPAPVGRKYMTRQALQAALR